MFFTSVGFFGLIQLTLNAANYSSFKASIFVCWYFKAISNLIPFGKKIWVAMLTITTSVGIAIYTDDLGSKMFPIWLANV